MSNDMITFISWIPVALSIGFIVFLLANRQVKSFYLCGLSLIIVGAIVYYILVSPAIDGERFGRGIAGLTSLGIALAVGLVMLIIGMVKSVHRYRNNDTLK